MDIDKKYTAVFKSLIRKHTVKGFIDYRASAQLFREINGVLQTGIGHAGNKHFRNALAIATSIIKPMVEAAATSDDSGGYTSGSIEATINLLFTIADSSEVPTDLKRAIV